MSLKQRVPLAFDAQGKPLYITLEWLKDLQAQAADSDGSSTVTQADFDSLQTTVNSQGALIDSLVAALAALTLRVEKLEGGYQS